MVERFVVIVAPSYDGLTRVLMARAARLASNVQGGASLVLTLLGAKASADEVAQVLNGVGECQHLLVFMGHGVSEALLTRPDLGGEGIQEHGVLIGSGNIGLLRGAHIMALACSAASGLGSRMRASGSGACFLGFRAAIPFDFTDTECERSLSAPFERAVVSVLGRGVLAVEGSDAELLQAEYKKEIDLWRRGGRLSGHWRAGLMRVFLHYHLRRLDMEV